LFGSKRNRHSRKNAVACLMLLFIFPIASAFAQNYGNAEVVKYVYDPVKDVDFLNSKEGVLERGIILGYRHELMKLHCGMERSALVGSFTLEGLFFTGIAQQVFDDICRVVQGDDLTDIESEIAYKSSNRINSTRFSQYARSILGGYTYNIAYSLPNLIRFIQYGDDDGFVDTFRVFFARTLALRQQQRERVGNCDIAKAKFLVALGVFGQRSSVNQD